MADDQAERNRASELGRLLRAGRAAKGWTLRQAAAETGISNGYLSLIEQGEVKSPSPKYLWALAEQYGVVYDDLMALAGHPSGPLATATDSPPNRSGRQLSEPARGAWGDPRTSQSSTALGGWASRALGTAYGVGSGDIDPAAWPVVDEEQPLVPADLDIERGTTGAAASAGGTHPPEHVLRSSSRVAADDLTEEERQDLLALITQDMRGFTAADIAQVRAFVAGMRATRRT